MKNLIYFVSLFCAIPAGFAQLKLIEFEQIDSLQKVEQRKIVVFIHTDWCKYCQVMKSKTLKNREIIKKLNDTCYFIDLNAEEKRNITFKNKIFQFKPTGNMIGIHELVIAIGTYNTKINYPTIAVLNEKNEIIFQYANFLNVKDFKLFLEKIDD